MPDLVEVLHSKVREQARSDLASFIANGESRAAQLRRLVSQADSLALAHQHFLWRNACTEEGLSRRRAHLLASVDAAMALVDESAEPRSCSSSQSPLEARAVNALLRAHGDSRERLWSEGERDGEPFDIRDIPREGDYSSVTAATLPRAVHRVTSSDAANNHTTLAVDEFNSSLQSVWKAANATLALPDAAACPRVPFFGQSAAPKNRSAGGAPAGPTLTVGAAWETLCEEWEREAGQQAASGIHVMHVRPELEFTDVTATWPGKVQAAYSKLQCDGALLPAHGDSQRQTESVEPWAHRTQPAAFDALQRRVSARRIQRATRAFLSSMRQRTRWSQRRSAARVSAAAGPRAGSPQHGSLPHRRRGRNALMQQGADPFREDSEAFDPEAQPQTHAEGAAELSSAVSRLAVVLEKFRVEAGAGAGPHIAVGVIGALDAHDSTARSLSTAFARQQRHTPFTATQTADDSPWMHSSSGPFR